MPNLSSDLPRALIIQLARLGDLLQSLPVLSSLRERFSHRTFNLLCPQPLVDLGKLFPGVQQAISWNGEELHALAKGCDRAFTQGYSHAVEYFSRFPSIPYSVAYNLNNHPRSILAAHLLSERVVGAGAQGPLDTNCSPWVEYLCQIAHERGANRIHLADAFCGICGVRPPVVMPNLEPPDLELPADIAQIVNDSSLAKIGIVLGAGDPDRRVPVATWKRLIEGCAEHLPNCVCVLIGGAGEREIMMAIENQLSAIYLSRILNCVGRTTLPQLANVFNRCQWVVGSDTGPLHLGVACGARAIGWYFSRARVHETGPYGEGHYVWQYRRGADPERVDTPSIKSVTQLPCSWPVMETLQLIQDQHGSENPSEWELWKSHRDEWGMFYMNGEQPDAAVLQRKNIWERLSAQSPNQYSDSSPHSLIAGCPS